MRWDETRLAWLVAAVAAVDQFVDAGVAGGTRHWIEAAVRFTIAATVFATVAFVETVKRAGDD